MNGFKINFRLKDFDNIIPFGEKPNLSLHWFGLTDGLLWIDVGTQTLYEYSDSAKKYFKSDQRYNEYYLSRFMEDFFATFEQVGESIPKELYDCLGRDEHPFKESDELDFDEYCELFEWREDRTFDSAHLTGGPTIGCFRHGESIKIVWESDFAPDGKNSIWTAPKGCFETSYDEFVLSVKKFCDGFFAAMNRQVENVSNAKPKGVFIDLDLLAKENAERKAEFLRYISFLENNASVTDWNKIFSLYAKSNETKKYSE